jgi:hypothetical protein
MQGDARLAPSPAHLRGDVDPAGLASEQTPEGGCAQMTQNSPSPEGEDSGRPVPTDRETAMPDGVGAAMNRMQPSGGNAFPNGTSAETEGCELVMGDNPMLPARNPCNQQITWLLSWLYLGPSRNHARTVAPQVQRISTPLRRKWRGPESNRRHHDFQSCALPTELPRQRVLEAAVRLTLIHAGGEAAYMFGGC